MEFADAQVIFVEKAKSLKTEALQNFESVEVRRDRACLRLRRATEGVVLEITHGPDDQPEAFWLDLYSDPIEVGEPSFHECVDHGLELLIPH
jgi:hypothetical protein